MSNNQSDKPEKLEPQDSKDKQIRHPKDDNEAVVKPEDKIYNGNDADFKNVAKKKELSEQPPGRV
jgi:hypothetical protein